MLASGALIASLLAVGATPAGADTDKADNKASTEACVGDAIADDMFTDVSDDHSHVDAINCVAYYGITNGTGDGSTYSPNDEVTRAQMAVFIAHAAGAAGVDLGDGSGGFDDIGDIWQEAQDAINGLASSGMIAKGGDFRPGDDITRAEMATFLVGLLAKAAPNVTIDSDGAIQLGESGSTSVADDHFADARGSLPRANDAEVSAIYELGITKGASAAATQDDTEPPLDYNYEPAGTVNRGQMAAFITRALAHTSVRPAGISAQYDGSDVVVSARDDVFQPESNVVVDLFTTDTDGEDLAFRGDGSCADVGKVSETGKYDCEIDGEDPITGGDGDASVPLGGVDDGGTVVWAWTGDSEDTIDEDTEGVYRLAIDEDEEKSIAASVRISTEFSGDKAHLGSSVLYTVQLEDEDGDAATNGVDGKKPAQFLVTLVTTAIVDIDPASDVVELGRNPQDASVVATLPLTTDEDGKATFPVSGLPDLDPGDDRDEYVVDIYIQPKPEGNAPPVATAKYYIDDADTQTSPSRTGLVPVRSGRAVEDGVLSSDIGDGLVFSTEDSSRAAGGVSVETAADFVAAAGRGASNRATVTVSDQYGDPLPGSRVWLTSTVVVDDMNTDDTEDDELLVIGGGRSFAVGRDGSYTFGYEREGDGGETEMLKALWDHDGDTCSQDEVDGVENTSWNVFINNNLVTDDQGDVTGADLNGDGDGDELPLSGAVMWDHDGDDGVTTDEVPVTKDCADTRPVQRDNEGVAVDPGDEIDDEKRTLTHGSAPKFGVETVQWAAVAAGDAETRATLAEGGYVIQEFDTETNTIFVATEITNEDGETTVDDDSALVVYYDSNDRFNKDGDATTYAGFEKALAKGASLHGNIQATGGSRATNEYSVTPE